MKEADNDLIKQISNLFEDYEEEYVPEEWAKFQKSNKKNPVIFPLWMKIAAALLLIASTTLLFKPFFITEKDVTINVVKLDTTDSNQIISGTIESPDKSQELAKINFTKKRLMSPVNQSEDNKYKQKELAVQHSIGGAAPVEKNTKYENLNELMLQKGASVAGKGQESTVKERNSVEQNSVNQLEPKVDRTLDFLLSESQKKNHLANNEYRKSKWDFGLGVIPTVSNSTVSVGAGLSTSYEISDKFSVSSGISIYNLESGTQVRSEAMPNAPIASGAFTLSDQKTYDGTNAVIKAIDIPLALVYKLNKNFYTSAGFSYVNVLSERRSNSFTKNSLVQRSSVDPITGTEHLSAAISSEKLTEPESVTPLKGNAYMGGFFNFSIGRRQHIFQKYDIRVEPFIKIPVGRLSKEDVQLMNSGIKLQFAF